jgi:hypothetical protein
MNKPPLDPPATDSELTWHSCEAPFTQDLTRMMNKKLQFRKFFIAVSIAVKWPTAVLARAGARQKVIFGLPIYCMIWQFWSQ